MMGFPPWFPYASAGLDPELTEEPPPQSAPDQSSAYPCGRDMVCRACWEQAHKEKIEKGWGAKIEPKCLDQSP